jgi:hypothetical protein
MFKMKQFLAGMKAAMMEGTDLVEQQVALKYDLLETIKQPGINDGLKAEVTRKIKRFDNMQNNATSWQEYAVITKTAFTVLSEYKQMILATQA